MIVMNMAKKHYHSIIKNLQWCLFRKLVLSHNILNIIYKNKTFVWFENIWGDGWGDESDDFDALGKYKNSLFKSSMVIFFSFSLFLTCSDNYNAKIGQNPIKSYFIGLFVVKKGGKMDSFASKLRRMHCSSSSRPTQIISML